MRAARSGCVGAAAPVALAAGRPAGLAVRAVAVLPSFAGEPVVAPLQIPVVAGACRRTAGCSSGGTAVVTPPASAAVAAACR